MSDTRVFLEFFFFFVLRRFYRGGHTAGWAQKLVCNPVERSSRRTFFEIKKRIITARTRGRRIVISYCYFDAKFTISDFLETANPIRSIFLLSCHWYVRDSRASTENKNKRKKIICKHSSRPKAKNSWISDRATDFNTINRYNISSLSALSSYFFCFWFFFIFFLFSLLVNTLPIKFSCQR